MRPCPLKIYFPRLNNEVVKLEFDDKCPNSEDDCQDEDVLISEVIDENDIMEEDWLINNKVPQISIQPENKLDENEYKLFKQVIAHICDLFAYNIDDLKVCNIGVHSIKLTDEEPIRQHPYKGWVQILCKNFNQKLKYLPINGFW